MLVIGVQLEAVDILKVEDGRPRPSLAPKASAGQVPRARYFAYKSLLLKNLAENSR